MTVVEDMVVDEIVVEVIVLKVMVLPNDGPSRSTMRGMVIRGGGGLLVQNCVVSSNRTQWVFTVDHVICKKNRLQTSCQMLAHCFG